MLVFELGEVETAVELVESVDLAVDVGGVLADVVEGVQGQGLLLLLLLHLQCKIIDSM